LEIISPSTFCWLLSEINIKR